MENNTMKKINNLGVVGHVICKITKIALIIAAVACFVAGVLMCFVPKEAVKIELTTENSAVIYFDESKDYSNIFDLEIDDGVLEIGDHTYKLIVNDEDNPDKQTTVFYLSNIKWVLFSAILALAAAYVVAYFADELFIYFKSCETPFGAEISKGIEKLAWSLIPMTVMSAFIEAFANWFLLGDFDLTIEITSVLFILFIFMLSFIFKHGTALQAESDETL